MYSNDRGFGLKDLIIKIIFLALFVLLMVWLFRTYTPNMKPFYSNVFRENISYMQDSAKNYFTTDKLPAEIGQSTKLTLKEMQEKKLLLAFVDKDGNSCNMYESYAEVTKEENGYILKTNLECNTEKDYVIEILGCYDYGCDKGCNLKETALEYQFTKRFSKTVTNLTCPKGYKRDGNYCYKTVGNETVGATKNYTDAYVIATGVLYTVGANQEIELKANCTTTTTQTKVYKDAIATTVTNGTCKDIQIKDPNCTVQCKMVWDSNSKTYVKKCNTCGYITTKDCSEVTTTTNYSCPEGYNDGYVGEGANKKCYKLVSTKTTNCTCPVGTDKETGSGENKKCYDIVSGAKTPYCENKDAKYDSKTNKCLLTVGGNFSHYSCPSNKYSLDKEKGTCTLSIVDKIKATENVSTKTWTQTKWSRSKTLKGWTATGKTRIVEL